MPVKDYWPLVLSSLKNNVSKSNYKAWLSELYFVEVSDQGRQLNLSVPSKFHQNYIKSKLYKSLSGAARKYYPKIVHIDISVDETRLKNKEVKQIQQDVFAETQNEPVVMARPVENATHTKLNNLNLNQSKIPGSNLNNLNPKYTFENFVTTSSNQLAVSVCNRVIDNPGKLYNPVFIYSEVGLGKPNLLHATGQQIITARPDLKNKYTT